VPFDDLETITKIGGPPKATISYMRSGRKGTTNTERKGQPRLIVTLPTTICGTGKMPRHKVLIGSGEDEGKLRIKGVAEGGVKPAEFKSHFIWRFGYVPRLGDEIFGAQTCAARKVDDDEFEVDVPASWFSAEAAE
jgi:hypothetical protein